jgi:DNA-binding transcriptional LysR family regulator
LYRRGPVKTFFTKSQKPSTLWAMDLLGAMDTFVRVVDAGSLSKAARALHVTPAAVSRQLTALEQELGVSLLVRTTRQIAVTEEGRRFYEHAVRTVSEAEEARAAVRADRAVSGLLTVSVPTALGLSLLDLTAAELVAENPGLRIDLRLEDRPVDLLAEGVDVAVRAGLPPPDRTTLVAQALCSGDRVVVAAPSYVRAHGEPRTPAELSKHDALVHLHAGADLGVWSLGSGTRSTSIEVTGSFRSNALHTLRNAAVSGAGIALLPWFVVGDDVEARRLRVLPLGGWAPPSQQVHALVRAEAKMRARVRVFVERARERLTERLRRPVS